MRALFWRNMQSFVKIKSSGNGGTMLSFTVIAKPCPSCDFNVTNVCFNAIHVNFQIYCEQVGEKG